MSRIRRQSIISTFFVYFGFAIGFVNTYLFTREGSPISTEQYGLTQIFIAVGNIMFAFANMGIISAMNKFYPYYNDNLDKKKNDLLTLALVISIIGFILVVIAGIVFKDLVIRKFTRQAPDFVNYYFWVFPFGFSILLFSIFETYAWNLRRSVLTNFLKEVLFRASTTILILLFSFKVIHSFDTFIKIYAWSYGLVALALFAYLKYKKELTFTFSISRVTRKFYKKIIAFSAFIYSGGLIYMIALFIDSITITALRGTGALAVFGLASLISGLVQAPQRGAVSSSTPVLSQAWKDKNLAKISMIYKRSSINLLILSVGLFLLIWLNYKDAIVVFNLKATFIESYWVFFLLGITRVIDLGTGVNSTIIGTSIYWRFEFLSGVLLLSLIIPLNYILVKEYGIIGAGYSNLISFTVYNIIRIIFLKRKFNMQPFTKQTIYAILMAVAAYFAVHFAFQSFHSFWAMVLKSVVFIGLYGLMVVYGKLSPDVMPVLQTLAGKMKVRTRLR